MFAETDGFSSDVHAVSISCRPDHGDEVWNELYFTQNRIVISTSETVTPWGSSGGAVVTNFFFNGDTNYPPGYEGTFIRATPPAPITTPVTGTIDCGGVDAVAMIIVQPYNNGSATLSPGSYNLTDWSYNLTTSLYQAQINCGGTWIYTPFVDHTIIDEDWVCDIYNREPTCV